MVCFLAYIWNVEQDRKDWQQTWKGQSNARSKVSGRLLPWTRSFTDFPVTILFNYLTGKEGNIVLQTVSRYSIGGEISLFLTVPEDSFVEQENLCAEN